MKTEKAHVGGVNNFTLRITLVKGASHLDKLSMYSVVRKYATHQYY